MAKSHKTAFIRVSTENDTKTGKVIYSFDDIKKCLDEWAFTAGIEFWTITHQADDEVSLTHFHIVIRFRSPMPFDQIKGRFPYGMIENARNIKACVQYLVHLNDSSKVSYDWSEIYTNCKDMTQYKVTTNNQQEIDIQSVIEKIKLGEIKEYNQFEKIPNELWSKYRTRIENSLLFEKEKAYMNSNREIKVIFLSGSTGTGKTTFAKKYCVDNNKSFCVSSASNDPLQDYKSQDVLILDDMRDDVFRFHDLLKFLDNHTKSTGKSRYHNKAFIGDTIIITSPKPVVDWYFNSNPEDKRQLYRRIKGWFKFTKEKIEAYEYSEIYHRYEKVAEMKNYITSQFNDKPKIAVDMLKSMGIEFETGNFKESIDIQLPENIDNKCLSEEEYLDTLDLKGKCGYFLQSNPKYLDKEFTAKYVSTVLIQKFPNIGLMHGMEFIIQTMDEVRNKLMC